VRLPNPERAIVDIAKLKDYCLDTEHEDGKHKARVFAAVLGVRLRDADWLQGRLREAAFGAATQTFTNEFGILYMVDFRMSTSHGEATVRSHWIVRIGEDFPRLTTCFVLKDSERRK
jgi:hypothetical protein